MSICCLTFFWVSFFFFFKRKINENGTTITINFYLWIFQQSKFDILALNWNCNWDALRSGYSANLVFEYIHQLKLYISSEEVEVDEIVDLEFLKKSRPDYMIKD